MHRRLLVTVLAAVSALSITACHNKKVHNPIAKVDTKQPDKVLFDRAMDAMKHNKFEVARLTLQTLINTYPDSEFIARAKLAVGDSWYAEGGSAGYAQAENEYNDFITFFPDMPEAAEAQMKIGKIHYDQMEKADRDFTHAKRAEGAYRTMIQQFPDSKLVPEAKARLREVQEVLAEREFGIGRFYYLRQSYPAAVARLKSMVDAYPLYSGADEALYMLGECYEGQINVIRASKGIKEVDKGKYLQELENNAANAFSRILTRYPVSERAVLAKERLQALHRPIPQATPEAIAQNKAEEESRSQDSFRRKLLRTFSSHPSVAEASKIGDPTLTDPVPTSAPAYMKHAQAVLTGGGDTSTKSLNIEKIGTGDAPPPNQAPPRSDDQGPQGNVPAPDTSVPELPVAAQTQQSAPAQAPAPTAVPDQEAPASDSSIPALPVTPAAQQGAPQPQSSSTAAAPASAPAAQSQPADTSAPPAPPAQVNDVNTGSGNSAATSSQTPSDDNSSSSKKKKKAGLGKLNPF